MRSGWILMALVGFLAGLDQVNGQCGNFRLAKYFASKMVLQKAPYTSKIWGYSDAAGDQVTVNLVGVQTVVATAVAQPDGTFIWESVLNAVNNDAGSYTIDITFNTCTIQLTDVLFGDVWICSGQSNMQFTMNELDNATADIDDSVNYPRVRTFFTALTRSDTAQTDLMGVERTWDLPNGASNIGPYSALCWLFGRNLFRKLNRPIGLIESNWGGTRIEAWSSPDALNQCFFPVTPADPPNGPSQLWNAMIHPFITVPIYGAIWYQGESNTGNADLYGCAIKAMVGDWRVKWFSGLGNVTNNFPFGQVQLAPWRDQDITTGFPDIRWQQTDQYGYTPNPTMDRIFTAVAIDLPDYLSPSGDIHPRYKRQIADRLSLGAFDVAYGQTDSGIYQGPIPTSFQNNGATIRVGYAIPVTYINGEDFELCCGTSAAETCSAGGIWIAATVSQMNVDNVVLDNPCSAFVTGFRYLWRESPCDLEACAVYSQENNLPAPPFLFNSNIAVGKKTAV